MHARWFRGVGFAASLLLALVMEIINLGFEALGSVPDVSGCGFLAGNLFALSLLYPLSAALIAARAVRPLARRFPERTTEIVAVGGWIGLLGSVFYLCGGAVGALSRPAVESALPLMSVLVAGFTLLSAFGGRLGAALTVEKSASKENESLA